jgi:hypothetical protein
MSAHSRLLNLYHEWRTWTDAEAEAIRGAAWSRVAECQEAKHRLQERILLATDDWRVEARAQGERHREVDPEVRRIVDELIRLEMRNSELVDQHKRSTKRQQQELELSTTRLRRLQRAYAPNRLALWQQYS